MDSLQRIWGLVYRHLAVYRRSWPRLVETAYFPTLELLIWGFTANFFMHMRPGSAMVTGGAVSAAPIAGALLAGVLLWQVMLRGQLGVTFTFLEEIWSRNLGHVFVSPLRPAEMVATLLAVSVMRTVIGVLPAIAIAYFCYAFNLFGLGPVLILFFMNLLVMGWWVALGIVALLFRYGAGAEALAWTLAFGITPLACVFYPVTVLPAWLQPFALALPAAHVFQGMRAALLHHSVEWHQLAQAALLNLIWMALSIAVFGAQFRAARIRGALISIGE
jgi:ABC-2 type transport system permease protein